jgi:hypothetical protein
VDDADFSSQMAAMREWLDRHGCEPARFVYDQTGNALVILLRTHGGWPSTHCAGE